MASDKEKVVYTKPTSQVDLEERLKRDNESPLSVVRAENNHNPFGVDEEAYVNVDPVYQNHANDTEKPLEAKSGVEKKALETFKDAVAAAETDYSNDQKPSGPYVDSSSPQGAGAQAGDGPFGGGDTGNDTTSEAGVSKGTGQNE